MSQPPGGNTVLHLTGAMAEASEPMIDAMEEERIRNDTTKLTIQRGRTRFNLKAQHALLAETAFYKEYENRLMQLQRQLRRVWWGGGTRVEPWVEPEEFFQAHFHSLIRQLAPVRSIRGLTIQDLATAPIYNLELVPGGPGSNVDVKIKGEENVVYAPCYDISSIFLRDLPRLNENVAFVDASDIHIAPTAYNANPDEVWSARGKVLLADGTARHFKPRTLRQGSTMLAFDRELELLMRIDKADLGVDEVRIPRLTEIVVSGGTAVGILLEFIPSYDLRNKETWENLVRGRKWEKQVTWMVRALHAKDIVWGNVKPGHVLIDQDLNAWISDFGGGNDRNFVDDELLETKEGDWQGIKELFREWLPDRRIGVHPSYGDF